MSWNPITLHDLKELIASNLNQMSEASNTLFKEYKVEYYQLPCIRSLEVGQELIFVVAAYEDRVLVFDDVENEFGIAIVPEDGILKSWGLYGDLEFALKSLVSH